jgi:hypothetical protein
MLRDSANQRSPNVIADIERPHLLAFPSNLHPFTRILLDPLLGDARVVPVHFLNHSLKMLRLDNKSSRSKVNIDRCTSLYRYLSPLTLRTSRDTLLT